MGGDLPFLIINADLWETSHSLQWHKDTRDVARNNNSTNKETPFQVIKKNALTTDVTEVRFRSSVDIDVILHAALHSEFSVTVRTLIWFLASVIPHVYLISTRERVFSTTI